MRNPTTARATPSFNAKPREEKKIHVYQGKYKVSDQPHVVLHTILGSCVATCLYDPLAGIGGMNHFLVPGGSADSRSLSHGAYSMELLINSLLKRGAQRDRLQAKLFGGAAVMTGLSNIGAQNAAFAEEFLATEGIPCVGKCLGGDSARRLKFWPTEGRARQLLIPITEVAEEPTVAAPEPEIVEGNDVELF